WKGLAETLAREDFEAIRAIGEHAVSRLHGFGILVRAAFLPLLDAHILVLPGILASRHDRVAMPFATDAAEPSAHSLSSFGSAPHRRPMWYGSAGRCGCPKSDLRRAI